jgi:hypothetical protein
MERNIRLNWLELVDEAVKRRKSQGLTQEQLSILAGVSQQFPTVFLNTVLYDSARIFPSLLSLRQRTCT